MRKVLALGMSTFALLLIGCNNPNKEVAGTWKADTKTIQIHVKDKDQDAMIQKALQDPARRKTMTDEFGKASISLSEDGKGSFTAPDGKTESGSYRVVGNKIEDQWGATKDAGDTNKTDITIAPDHKRLHMHIEGKFSGLDMLIDVDFDKVN